MMTEIRKRTFDNTTAAIAVYDAGAAERAAAWDDVMTGDEVEKALENDLAALRLVQEAFHKDTSDINSLDHCYRADIGFMRRMTK